MKILSFATVVATTLMMVSCSTQRDATPKRIMPTAINEINAVSLKELNLTHEKDYTILNTVTAAAVIYYSTQRRGEQITIREGEHDEFKLVYKYDDDNGEWYMDDYEGIARFGFFSHEVWDAKKDIDPSRVANSLATYRLINLARVSGADGVIEPVYSTAIEERDKEIIFTTTVSAKLIKLKADSK